MTAIVPSVLEPEAVLPSTPTPQEAEAAARRLGPADDYITRVLDIAGARPLALDALLRVARVEWSAEVPTACIECADRPRLLLNAAFVEARCHTAERLATLVLHELAHVAMGHTRLFPRPTWAHNVACDAIINRDIAGLAMECGADLKGLTALLVECYPANAAPWFLLRPPPGWPAAPDWNASTGCSPALRTIHKRLYDTLVPEDRHGVQYSEIMQALRSDAGIASATDSDWEALLGAHGTSALEAAALSGARDVAAGEVLGDVLARITGRVAGAGGNDAILHIRAAARRADLERALRTLLHRCAHMGTHPARSSRHALPSRTVMPHHDRRAAARIALAKSFGAPRPLLFASETWRPHPEPVSVTIYLDVSGSMSDVLPVLHAALVPLRRTVRARILCFSTRVFEPTAEEFNAGRVRSTGGTSVDPALAHLLESHRQRASSTPTTALLLTDGYFDAPKAALLGTLNAQQVRVHIGVMGSGPLHDGASWVASSTRLPST